MSAPNHRSPCPVVFALDVFGDRWSLLIVRDMVLKGHTTYGEFLKSGEGISTNILADRLKRLEEEGIVTREPDPDHGVRVRYGLTAKGLDLVPVLIEMIRWSARHDPSTPMKPSLRRRIEREPRKVAADLVRRVRSSRGPRG